MMQVDAMKYEEKGFDVDVMGEILMQNWFGSTRGPNRDRKRLLGLVRLGDFVAGNELH